MEKSLQKREEECPNRNSHTLGPDTYMAWQFWAEGMDVTHEQSQCPECGLWVVWEPKETVAPLDKSMSLVSGLVGARLACELSPSIPPSDDWLKEIRERLDAIRQSGRTTKQMVDAPQGSLFIWCNSQMGYPTALAEKLGRSDLIIKPVSWLAMRNTDGVDCRKVSGIVVDHCVRLDWGQLKVVEYIEARIRVRQAGGGDGDL